MQVVTPAQVLQTRSNPDNATARLDATDSKTRRKYARIRLVDTGIVSPSVTTHPNALVPFIVRLEPLYLGVIPASVFPVLVFLVLVVAFAVIVMVPRIQVYLAKVADDARDELAIRSVQADKKKD